MAVVLIYQSFKKALMCAKIHLLQRFHYLLALIVVCVTLAVLSTIFSFIVIHKVYFLSMVSLGY